MSKKQEKIINGGNKATRLDFMLVSFAGILYFLSFPRHGIFLCAWVFLVPLFFALKNKSVKSAARLGFAAGFIGNLGVMYWITHAAYVYGGVPLVGSILIMLLLVAYMSCYFLVFATIASKFMERPALIPIVLPALWVALEYIRAQALSGFPWASLGYSQVVALPLVQMADLAGVYGISFLLVFVASIIFLVFGFRGWRIAKAAYAIMALAAIGSTLIYGYLRIDAVERAMADSDKSALAVTLLQGNIPQDIKWEPRYQNATVHKYAVLAQQAKAPAGIVIFPESAMPFFLDEGIYKEMVMRMIKDAGAWGVVGALAHHQEGGFSISNSAFVVSPDGIITGRYDKVHLVPFGEYVPRVIPFVKKIVADIGDIKEGSGFSPVHIANITAGVLICYEAIFPEIARAYALQDVDIIINITNDGWYGRSSAPYQHLDMAVMRAIETRRYLLRAANTGVSAVIAPTGKITVRSDTFVEAMLDSAIHFIKMNTFYAGYGDWFVYLNFMLLLVLCVEFSRLRKRSTT